MSLKTYTSTNSRYYQSKDQSTFQGLLIIKWFNQVTNNPRYQTYHNTTLNHMRNLESKKLVHICL